MKVLVVEDTPPVRMTITSVLRAMGHEFIEAEDGETALEHFQNYEVDLVLMDVEMPGIDGFEATRQIRNGTKESAFVLVSAPSIGDEEGDDGEWSLTGFAG